MFKKLKTVLMSSSALFLIGVATSAISVTSFVHHGEPACPKELLK